MEENTIEKLSNGMQFSFNLYFIYLKYLLYLIICNWIDKIMRI